MQEERIDEGDPDAAARLVLDLLTERYPALVPVEELLLELSGGGAAGHPGKTNVDDVLAELVRSGLAHQVDDVFLLASRAAVRGLELGY